MPTLGSALQIGKSALRAQQIGLNVVGNNIANVNTPGYSRQKAVLQSDQAVRRGVGRGVTVQALTRHRDRFLDGQFHFEAGSLGKVEAQQRLLSLVEAIFTEMAGGGSSETSAIFNQASGAGMSGGFSRFYNAFQDLANDPQSQSARAQVREEAAFLIEQFHRLHDNLAELKNDIDVEVKDTVREINRITGDIARLNKRILASKSSSTDVAGNLDDERDRQIDALSKLIDVRVRENANGTFTVSGAAGAGVTLVDAGTAVELGTLPISRGGAIVSDITLASTQERIDLSMGKLGGLMAVRDQNIVEYTEDLNSLAATFVERVNAVHGGGFGLDGSSGNYFFEPVLNSARDIRLSSDIQDSLSTIATAAPGVDNPNIPAGAGDGSVAQAIADLQHERSFGGGSQTVEEFYSQLVGRIGAQTRGVINDLQGQELVIEQVSNQRENVRGVSINEEASDLILFQRAYQAAARLITVVDEMMQTALNI